MVKCSISTSDLPLKRLDDLIVLAKNSYWMMLTFEPTMMLGELSNGAGLDSIFLIDTRMPGMIKVTV